MKPDIADKVQAYSVTTQIESVKELHENLLRGLERYIPERERPFSIAVLGLGAQVLPYGNNLKWFSKYFKNGKVVLMDYNPKILRQAEKYLRRQGFSDYFDFRKSDSEVISLDNLDDGTIVFRESNLKNPLPLKDSSLNFVDSTLTLHHIAAYKEKLKECFGEIYRVLNHGGLFHLGEGAVNMRRSEENIDSLLNLLKDVYFEDQRDQDFPIEIRRGSQKYHLVLTRAANFEIEFAPGLEDKIRTYNPDRKGKKLVFPLIDGDKDADFIEEVNLFYVLNNAEKIKLLGQLTPKRILDAIEQGIKERNKAQKGMVEYYSPLPVLLNLLDETGFAVDYQLTKRKVLPFVNIFARKL